MLKQLYYKVLRYAGHPQAEMALFLVALMESSFFPIPPDVLLIPMVLVRFDRAFRYAAVCTLGSVLGGIIGYGIGLGFHETLGDPIINFYHAEDKFLWLQGLYAEYGAMIVGAAGFSPIPYKVFTIFSGVMQMDFATFVIASAISRGARFFLIAWLLWRGGPRFKLWIEKHFYPLTMIGTVVLLLLVVLIKFILA